jgi:hypothetical protein
MFCRFIQAFFPGGGTDAFLRARFFSRRSGWMTAACMKTGNNTKKSKLQKGSEKAGQDAEKETKKTGRRAKKKAKRKQAREGSGKNAENKAASK